MKVDHDNDRVFVSFLYWGRAFDTWVNDVSNKCAYLHTHTYTHGGVLRVGQRLDVLDECNKWLEAFVIEERPSEVRPLISKCFILDSVTLIFLTQVLIHFKGFHKKFDVWLPRGHHRIRQFGFGDNMRNARYTMHRQWQIPGKPSSTVIDRTRKIVSTSDSYDQYTEALRRQGFSVYPVAGDGNCLFRAVAHQVYGDDGLHGLVRDRCMDYMEVNASFFSLFVEGGMESFGEYISTKRELGCWGDDPEIQAICELYGRRAQIWAFDPSAGARKLRTFHEVQPGSSSTVACSGHDIQTINLSFYGGGHYDSLVGSNFNLHLIRQPPGVIEAASIMRTRPQAPDASSSRSRFAASADADVARSVGLSSDIEATENASIEMAVAASRKDMESFGEEDLETCLALSLSSIEAKGGVSTGVAMAEAKSSPHFTLDEKKSELDLDDKAMLDFYLKESADEQKTRLSAEQDTIEAAILEQTRLESLGYCADAKEAPSTRGGTNSSDVSSSVPPLASTPLLTTAVRTEQDEVALAIQRSEEEMLQQALLLSQRSSGLPVNSNNGNNSIDLHEQDIALADEEALLQLAVMESMMTASSDRGFSRGLGQHPGSHNGNNNDSAGYSNGNSHASIGNEEEDEDLMQALAMSLQQR